MSRPGNTPRPDHGLRLLRGLTPTVEVVGWRDANGNDFEVDASGNLTSKPLDLSRLIR